ncbi:MAG: cadherin-like domain-containing protein [Alphaproteobacteria bacterium]
MAYDTFTFQVRDDGGTPNGGQDTDQTPNTMTIDVTPVDDPPILNTNNPITVLEGGSEIIDTTELSTSDIDTADVDIIYTITTPPVNGFIALTSAPTVPITTFTQEDIANNLVTYVHDDTPTTSDSFEFTVEDGTTTLATETFDIIIVTVNDAPEGTDNTLTTLEDTPLAFTAADFGFSDPADAPSNNFQSVVITTLPTNGILELSGVAVTAGQDIALADIPNLTFTPSLNENGIGYTDFTFQVRDDGGTAFGGVDLDQSPNTMTIDVTPVNDAPDGTDTTVTTLEDTDYVFDATDFGFTDADDVPANNLQSVIITTLPATGTLNLSGVAVTAGQEILLADIPNLTFTPLADENGAGYDTFTFQVRDDGGTVNGGIDLDGTLNTMTIDVTSVNDEPDGTDNTLTTLEDTPYSFSGADFGLTDATDTPANALQSVIITTLPADGILELSGVAVTAGQEITAANIPNLTFTPTLNEFGTGYTDFTYQVRDDGGTADGGVDLDSTPNTITFDVTQVDDPPEGTDNTVTTLEDTPYTFSDADFGFTDTADTPADNFASVIITTLPTNGVLELSGVAVTAGQDIALADIPNLTFTPAADANGLAYDTFTFQVRDDAVTNNTDVTPNTMTIDVTPVDDPPILDTNATLTTFEGNVEPITTAFLSSSDIDTAPADITYTVTATPTNGQLELTSAPGVAITSFTQEDLDNGLVVYAHDNTSTISDSFVFEVSDATTNIGSATFDITILPVNDAPLGTDNTLTTLEDTPLGFTAADFGFTDPDDSIPNNFQSVIITTLPANGTLELSGVAVTAGQEIVVADIPNLSFVPTADENGTGYGNFTFQVRDDGGTANGGVDIDPTPNTMAIDVTSVNDEPDGTDNTINFLENDVYTFAGTDFGLTDPNDTPANNLNSVIITTLPTVGTLELSGVAVTAGQEILAADIPNLTFTPVPNGNGVGYDSFTFQVRDDDGTANSGIDLDSTPNTITFDVEAVNSAPYGTDNTLTTLEDTPYSFDASDFGFSDPDDVPSDDFQSVIITTLPADGILELSGVAVTAGQNIALADIPYLTFTPTTDENGIGYTNFTFQVVDDGEIVNGVNTDQSPNIITFDVTPVNDAPDGTDVTLTTLEDTPLSFAASDFGFTDPNDTPANSLQSVIITTLPTNGILELSGVAVTAGQEIAAADIPNLAFTPAANENGAGYDNFTFQVRDDGGTANGGINLDGTANTVTIDVTPVNDAPDGTDNTVTTLEDTGFTFSAADFGLTDADDVPANNLASVIISTLPVDGTLELSGVAVTAGQEILAADIPNLIFTPAANENGTGYANFDFQVRDDGGTANAGIDLDATPNTMTIDVTSVNDAPDGADITLTTLEDTPYNFDATDFSFTDVNDTPSNNLQSVVITTLPANGILELSGVAVTAGQEIAVADIPNLTFTPTLNENGVGYTDFTFQVRDDGGTADGGVDLDQTANTITFDVASVNDEPDGTDTLVSTDENINYDFTAADFGFTDANDTPANALQSVIITTLPVNGTLELSGVAVTAGQEIAVADIPNLAFVPVPDENGPAYADFTFQVRDDGGTADGGVDLDSVPNTITIDVVSVNDAPEGTDTTLTTNEDVPYTFSAADFGYSDPNDTPPDNFDNVIITTLPVDGILELSGVAVTAGQVIAVADIPNLTYTPTLNEFGTGYADFTFQVQDDGGTNFAGIDTDQSPNTITFDVLSVNDEPEGADNTLTTLEDTTLTFSAADFGFSDVNDAPNNLQSVIITTLPVNGSLELSGVAVTAGQEIAVADIPNLTFDPASDANGLAYDTFTFQVRDDGGTPNGGQDTDQTPNTMTIDVTPVDDPPILNTNNPITVLEGGSETDFWSYRYKRLSANQLAISNYYDLTN